MNRDMAHHLERRAVRHNIPGETAQGQPGYSQSFAASMQGRAPAHSRRYEQCFQTEREGPDKTHMSIKISDTEPARSATICCWLGRGSPVGSHTPKVLLAHRMHHCAALDLDRRVMNLSGHATTLVTRGQGLGRSDEGLGFRKLPEARQPTSEFRDKRRTQRLMGASRGAQPKHPQPRVGAASSQECSSRCSARHSDTFGTCSSTRRERRFALGMCWGATWPRVTLWPETALAVSITDHSRSVINSPSIPSTCIKAL